MEFLQTLWTALTTKNDTALNIAIIPMMFLELTLIMLFFIQVLNITATRKQKIIYLVLSFFVGLISHFLIPEPFNTFVNMTSILLLVFLIFRTTLLKAILAEALPYIIFILLGSIFLKLYSALFNIHTEMIRDIPIHKLGFSLFLYFCVFLVYLLLKKFKINIQLLDKMKERTTVILVINFVVGIIAISIHSYILSNSYVDSIPTPIVVASMIILTAYYMISMYSLFRTNQLEITTKRLEEEKLYNKTLTILYDNVRMFKHDFNNIVQAIGGYISTKDLTGLSEYHSQLLGDCRRSNTLNLLNPELISDPAIYSLLTSKYHKADEMGIKVSIEAFLDLTSINMKIYELTKVLGILLDNAIEAADQCDEKVINIVLRKDSKAHRHLFQIENTYVNKNINIDQIFEKGFTSKTTEDKKSHGLGLWEVRKILKKNNNLNLYTTKDDTLFKQQLEIYY